MRAVSISDKAEALDALLVEGGKLFSHAAAQEGALGAAERDLIGPHGAHQGCFWIWIRDIRGVRCGSYDGGGEERQRK